MTARGLALPFLVQEEGPRGASNAVAVQRLRPTSDVYGRFSMNFLPQVPVFNLKHSMCGWSLTVHLLKSMIDVRIGKPYSLIIGFGYAIEMNSHATVERTEERFHYQFYRHPWGSCQPNWRSQMEALIHHKSPVRDGLAAKQKFWCATTRH